MKNTTEACLAAGGVRPPKSVKRLCPHGVAPANIVTVAHRNLLKNHNCSFLQRQTTVWFWADIFTYGTVLEEKICPINNVNHRNIHLAISIHDDISALDFLPDLGGIENGGIVSSR